MGFDFSGHVLRGPRIAATNAASSAEPTNGVVRDVKAIPGAYDQSASFDLVDAWADQYRASILDAPGTTPTEYLFWAANTSNLSLVDDASWWFEQGSGRIPSGVLTATNLLATTYEQAEFYDGSDKIVVVDNDNRTLSLITHIVFARGDVDDYDDTGWVDSEDPSLGRTGDKPYLVFTIPPISQDPNAGFATLSAADLILLDGGASNDRQDRVISVRYTVASARFWWTRNDRYEVRFGFNGKSQKWEPFKGSAPKDLGRLAFDQTYTLSPRVSRLPSGSFLPGDALVSDSFCMVRLGDTPNALSTPVAPGDVAFEGIQVREDGEIEGFDFTGNLAGVVGRGSGVLVFNPAYVEVHAGKTVWYMFQDFEKAADGVLGVLGPDRLFLSPVPGPTDHPFLRLGSRRDLSVTLVATDALLDLSYPAAGSAVVSLATGQVRLSASDIAKADPTSATFDKFYLGEQIVYAGTALNQTPQPTKAPVRVTTTNGATTVVGPLNDLYLPDSVVLPEEFAADDVYRGLGVSGVLDVPDGTGTIPGSPGSPADTRPGGTIERATTGRLRQVVSDVGASFFFSRKGALKTLEVVARPVSLPSERTVPKDSVYVALEYILGGSQIALGPEARSLFAGDPLYFIQAELTPASYTTTASLVSRNRLIFRFDGTEVLYFAADGTVDTWASSSLLAALPNNAFFTAGEVAASIQIAISGTGTATALNGRVVLAGVTSVEIGWGAGSVKDLSGATALGFLPGWRAVDGVVNWLPDTGISLGLRRSPLNLDRSAATADYKAEGRVEDFVLQDSIPGQPFVFLDHVPIQDTAGFDEGVFFNLTSLVTQGDDVTLVQRPLEHYQDVQYRFGQGKFAWLEENLHAQVVQQPLTTLGLGRVSIVPETMLNAPGIGGGLFVAETGGRYELLEQGVEYLLPQDGQTGYALLSEQFGGRVLFGGLGSFTGGDNVLTDPLTDFTSMAAGYRLKVTLGPTETIGSYLIQEIVGPSAIRVSPPFVATSDLPVTWEVYTGYTPEVFDPSVVADASYKSFTHLPVEPFQARVLSLLGATPVTAAAQSVARLQGDIGQALESGRATQVRFGLEAPTVANTGALLSLVTSELGALANDVLVVPETDHFSVDSFSIQVGTELFSQGVGLTGVTAFSGDPGSGAGVEYLQDDWVNPEETLVRGTLRFGSAVLSDLDASTVFYVEAFRGPADVPSLTVELDTNTGTFNIAQTEIDAFGPLLSDVYFVEQMVTEDRQDVGISPMIGAFSFNTPISAGQVVEVSYYAADLEGRKVGAEITEFLPVFVRDEIATKLTGQAYLFNTGLKTIDPRMEPVVYIGPVQQNFGVSDFNVDYLESGEGRITFLGRTIADYLDVSVSYAVFEAAGGERSYESSTKPVYRPPFFIKKNISEFGLRGNRTSDFQVGQMLRVGEYCFYIQHLTYYPPRLELVGPSLVQKGDVTGVGIFPPTLVEVGSRSPGNDVLSLVTDRPIAIEVDPDGNTPIVSTGAVGFWQTLPLATFPFEPVNRGQATILFMGNLTSAAVAGHILELGGVPYTIGDVVLSDDGTRTKFTLTSPFFTGYHVNTSPTVRISYRPVYPPDARGFVGRDPLINTEPYELVLFGETDSSGVALPGRTLAPTVEYILDPTSGAIGLMEPFQDALGPNQTLYLSYTKQRVLTPYMSNGVVISPRYQARYFFNTIPSTDNGFLGGRLTATYSFRSPDTYYTRVVLLQAFLSEAVEEAVASIQASTPAGGPLFATAGDSDNWDQGRVGLSSQRRHLEDLDRSARVFLDFYNTTVLSFEQIQETLSGGFIGDRDGKFRFFVGRGLEYAPPGYEDPVTGVINTRNVFSLVFNAADPNRDLVLVPGDNIVVPTSAQVAADGYYEGDFLDVAALDALTSAQPLSVLNDVDDVILLGLDPPSKVTTPGVAPYYKFQAKGRYDRMAGMHSASRLFPRETKAFFITWPGIGTDGANPGFYTAGRIHQGRTVSTRDKQIGQLANPVLGDIGDVSSATLFRRKSRARIWGFYPNGIPAGAFDLDGDGVGDSAAITDSVVIATPGLLRDFPINPATGYPDHTKFLSQGGELPDIEAGDPELAVPGFSAGEQVAWGTPNGAFQKAFDSTHGVSGAYIGVFVDTVLYGCVLTFKDGDTGAALGPDVILVDETLASLVLEQGDTILTEAEVNFLAGPASDPPTTVELVQAAAQSDNFRLGFDLEIRQDGSVFDVTLPSNDDPVTWGLKEIMGQNPPSPQTPLEGPVQFVYTSQLPLSIPALKGLSRDDTGDFQIPYLKTGNTELDRMGEASAGLALVMQYTDSGGLYVYPDEVIGSDGSILGVLTGTDPPATLLTTQDFLPAPALGVGVMRPYDLLLIETDDPDAGNPGIEGILSVGAVDTNQIEPPRFITGTTPPPGVAATTGSPVRYVLNYGMVWMDTTYPDAQAGTPPPGMTIVNDTTLVTGTMTLRLAGIGGTPPKFHNGTVSGTGGLNNIIAASATNEVRIDIIGRLDTVITDGPLLTPPAGAPANWPEGLVIQSFIINSTTITGIDYDGNPLVSTHSGVTFGNGASQGDITFTGLANPVVAWGPGGGGVLAWYLPHSVGGATKTTVYGYEFAISVDTYNPALSESDTAFIGLDRLTFNEAFDLSFARIRGFVHPEQVTTSLETDLTVHEVTAWGGAGFSTINADVNGAGNPFTFLARAAAGAAGVGDANGTFLASDTGVAPELGTIKVMGFEGHGNTPVTATGITFSAIPSSTNGIDSALPICTGVGETESENNVTGGMVGARYDNRVTALVTSAPGSAAQVEPGDVLVIQQSSSATHWASQKAGSYLIHHALDNPTPSEIYKGLFLSATAGLNPGWTAVTFPTVVLWDGTSTLTVSSTAGYAGTGTLYLVRSLAGLASSDLDVFRESVISAAYTGTSDTEFTGVGSFKYADGMLISVVHPGDEVAIWASLVFPGLKVSGRTSFPVDVSPYVGGTLQSRNVVGWEGASAIHGFRYLTFRGLGVSDVDFDGGAAEIETSVTPSLGTVGVIDGVVPDNWLFAPGDPERILYPHVPVEWGFNLTTAQWETVNIPAGSAGIGNSGVDCLLPNTAIDLADLAGTTEGFHVQTGIFLEPSWPTPVFDLATGGPHVVDFDHDLTDPQVGMRNAADFLVIPVGIPESVSFEVRRIRRFHDVNGVVGQNFEPLRYAYEIRRGRITAYTTNAQSFGVVTADSFVMDVGGTPRTPDVWNDGQTYTGTHLGGFNDPDVNIHPGDMIRVLDGNGIVQEEAIIAQVVDDRTLKLEPPGLITAPAADQRFEIYLRQAPVPHEQSNEQLLDLITDTLVHQTFANEGAETGGYVPNLIADTNKLYDDLEAPGNGSDFADLGVRPGDIVLIDPMGTMPNGETGAFPIGDTSILTRGAPPHVAGGPTALDDNRGWYRVVSVQAEGGGDLPHLVVTGESTFTGIDGADVAFPDDAGLQADMGYAVYPAISGSALTGTTEGQMDLRPTAVKVGGFYATDDFSIRPFSYRILRPSPLFSSEAIDLVLMHRERILSLLEFYKGLMTGSLTGNYFVFQRDNHAHNLGDPADFLDGVGVLTNAIIEALVGEVDESPYINSSTGLSLHDRRFWIMDRRLDSLAPDTTISSKVFDPSTDPAFPFADGPYTAYTDEDSASPGDSVRPTLPDRIEAILNTDERFRPLRFTWLSYRTHRVLGTLASLDRYDADLPERLAEQQRLLDIQEGVS